MSKKSLIGDLIAGLMVALVLIPQGMAYAVLAGMPPIVGIYAGILPTLIYGLAGSTRILTLGPTSITSLLVFSTISKHASVGSEMYLALASTLTLTLGILLLLLGILRFGFITNLLSQPVLFGYINGASIIIILSQLQYLLGIKFNNIQYPLQFITQLFAQLSQANITVIFLSLCSFLFLFVFSLSKKFFIQKSSYLILVILLTFLTFKYNLHEIFNINIVGNIPSGFPVALSFDIQYSYIPELILGAFAIAIVGLMEGISTIKSIDSKSKVNANQELIAMGLANLGSVFTSGLAVTSSISRSSVNASAGGNSWVSSAVTAIVLLFIAVFLSSYFTFLPKFVLACIIIFAVARLIDFTPIIQIWRHQKLETLPFWVTFISIFFINILFSLFLGVLTSIVIYLLRTIRPHIYELGRYEYSKNYHEIHTEHAYSIPNVLILRIDESLYFANAQYIDGYVRNLLNTRENIKYLILDASAINSLDASALQILDNLIDDLETKFKIQFYLVNTKEAIQARTGHLDKYKMKNIHEAVKLTGKLIDKELPL